MPSFFQGDPGHRQWLPPAMGPRTHLPSRPVGARYLQRLDPTWESLNTGSPRLMSPTATHSLQNRLGTQGFSSRNRLQATAVGHDAFPQPAASPSRSPHVPRAGPGAFQVPQGGGSDLIWQRTAPAERGTLLLRWLVQPVQKKLHQKWPRGEDRSTQLGRALGGGSSTPQTRLH